MWSSGCAANGAAPATGADGQVYFEREDPRLDHVGAEAVPAVATALEVVLTDGRMVRVAPGFDAATLRQLLAVLQEGGPC